MLISGRISDKWNLFVGNRRLDTSGPPAIVFTDNSIVNGLNSLRVITIARQIKNYRNTACSGYGVVSHPYFPNDQGTY